MKLCIAGNSNIAVDLLYYSFKYFDKSEVCVLLNKNDVLKNNWQKSLGFYAKHEKIAISNLYEVEQIVDIIFISVQFDRIIKPDNFNTPNLFNLHFSYLPEYKGMYPSVVPILDCKNYSGITLHKIDKGIDTGDIIAQKKYSISNLTSEQLYRKNLIEGFELIVRNFESIIKNNYTVKRQSSIKSTYTPKNRIDFSNLEIDTNNTAYQIFRFVRAFNFKVYQLPTFKGRKINKVVLTKNRSNQKPGFILESNFSYDIVATIDYDVKLIVDFDDDLIRCCINNDIERAKVIIRYIDNIDFFTREGWTPLMIAAYHSSFEVLKLLVEHNANIDSINLNGTTVLMYAKDGFLKTNSLLLFDYLIRSGANKFAKDIYGKTVFDYCDKAEIQEYR